MSDPTNSLKRILQNAHAGELAAALAYRGHWKSVRDSEQRSRIKRIEAEEWDHRARVREWLRVLEVEPRRTRERVFRIIGGSLGLLCRASGWFFPMYFAGRLESRNTKEYSDAAVLASLIGMSDCAADMLEMSEKELEHEEFFRAQVAGHWLLPSSRLLFRWG